MNTIPFGPRNPSEDPLLAKAAELPKDVEPPHDLWPGIAARLGEAPRATGPRGFRWPMALAAGFLVASVSALLTWSLMRAPDPAVPTPVADAGVRAADIVPVNYGPNSGLTAQELMARDELVARFREILRDAPARDAGRDREESRDHAGRGQPDRRRTREGPRERHAERHADGNVQAGIAIVFDGRHLG